MTTATTSEQPAGADAAHDALYTILETAEYISDRTTRLSTNLGEGIKAGETLGAVARQVRTLSANTSLEASRLGGSATVAEIARQMRLLSQQVSVLTEHVSACLRSQNVALSELSSAIDTLLADTASTQALLPRGGEPGTPTGPALPAAPAEAAQTVMDGIPRPEARAHG